MPSSIYIYKSYNLILYYNIAIFIRFLSQTNPQSLIRTFPSPSTSVFHPNDIKGDAQGSESGRVAPLTSSPFLSSSPFPSRAHLHPVRFLPLEPFLLLQGARFKTRITPGGSNSPFRYYPVGRVMWEYNVSRFKGKNSDHLPFGGHPFVRASYCRDRWEKRERVHCVQGVRTWRWLMEVRCRQVE